MNREGGNFTVRYNDRDIRPDSTMNWGDIIPKTIINFFLKVISSLMKIFLA